MQRRSLIGLAIGGTTLVAAGTGYLLSDRRSLLRSDIQQDQQPDVVEPDEKEILFLASLAPSGHNTQPWFVERLAPFHWIIGNDHRRWLPAVDPDQRETLLSIGAFLQSLELAAGALGYVCQWTLLATTNQDEHVMEVTLTKIRAQDSGHIEAMKVRRTMRAGFSTKELKAADIAQLIAGEPELIHYLPTNSREASFVNHQTIEANRQQSYCNAAQQELADWIRFSSDDARKQRDGLTTGSMQIEGMVGWAVRNFYGKADVLKPDFRERGIDQARKEVMASAGWLVITSRNVTVAALLEAGRRMQRLFLKVRARGIGLHPMTQILEETSTRQALPVGIGIADPVQFLLRVGYVSDYPPPVSLRRPVTWFLRQSDAPRS